MAQQEVSAAGADPVGESTRSTIVRIATEVFARRGYNGASVREIAELAGITKGNLTYHFAVKDDLLFAVTDRLHDAFLALAATWPAIPGGPKAALRAAAHDHVLLVCTQTSATRVSYEGWRHLSEQRRATIVHKRDRYEAELRRLIVAARRGEEGTATLDTRLVLGILNWPYQWFAPGGDLRPDQLATSIADMALRALCL